MVMFELGPIGCIPSIKRMFNHTGQCIDEINHFITLFNDQFIIMVQNLTLSLPGSTFILGHIFWITYDAVIKPSKYGSPSYKAHQGSYYLWSCYPNVSFISGLIDSTNPCCITWLNGTLSCIPEVKAKACKDPDKHLFWDGYHLTEGIYRTIASYCLNGSSVCIPRNLQDLVSQIWG